MNRKKRIVSVLVAIGSLAPAAAQAVPLKLYEQAASDSAKQSQMLKDAYDTAVARTVTGLRSPSFTDGREKTPQRLARDRKLAEIVDDLAAHMSDAQSGALIILIDQYAKAQPNTELEDVITSFLLTEAKKRVAQGQ